MMYFAKQEVFMADYFTPAFVGIVSADLDDCGDWGQAQEAES
jgi:hypothetical protein